ncbi:MAG: hypothetical protein V1815_02155 [Candidatus Woesearchaeota archaeon]
MHKISIVGIDNTGKTSIVKYLNKIERINTIHLTSCQNNYSRFSYYLGQSLNKFVKFGENNNLRLLTGLMYFLHLFPYYLEEKAKNSSLILISDRDPIIDTICYSSVYLPNILSNMIKPHLKFILKQSFNYPSLFFYLEVTPEISSQRNNKKKQLHDRTKILELLKESFDREIFDVENIGIPVIRFDTNQKSLEEVIDEVKFSITKLL